MIPTDINNVSYFVLKQYDLLPYINTVIDDAIVTFLMRQ